MEKGLLGLSFPSWMSFGTLCLSRKSVRLPTANLLKFWPWGSYHSVCFHPISVDCGHHLSFLILVVLTGFAQQNLRHYTRKWTCGLGSSRSYFTTVPESPDLPPFFPSLDPSGQLPASHAGWQCEGRSAGAADHRKQKKVAETDRQFTVSGKRGQEVGNQEMWGWQRP